MAEGQALFLFFLLFIIAYLGVVFMGRVSPLAGCDSFGSKEAHVGVVASTETRLSLLVAQVWRKKVVFGDLADGFKEGGWPEGEQVQRTFLDVL